LYLRGLLFELRSEDSYSFLKLADRGFLCLYIASLFFDFFVFFEELVKQHHVDRVIARALDLALSIADRQIRIHLGHLFSNQAVVGIRGYWLPALENKRKEVGKEAGLLSAYYARLGDREQALYWLDRAYEQRTAWLAFAKVTPVYDNLRSDPRFQAFLQRMGF
jgi:hypothetical protein